MTFSFITWEYLKIIFPIKFHLDGFICEVRTVR